MTSKLSSGTGRRAGRDATLLVALAATMWGLDPLLRKALASRLDAGTVVLWEHIIAIVVLAPFVPSALRAFARCRVRDQVAVVIVGGGSSALATVLFTHAFALSGKSGDYVTPAVLQQLQPLVALALAVVLLRERLRVSYAYFAVPALVGAWLLAFDNPFHVQVSVRAPAACAGGAAVLGAAGTVLGRLLSFTLTPRETTTLRITFGLLGSILIVIVTDAQVAPGWHNATGLILLALIPGVFALMIYYFALARTPASRATLAELALPATYALVGVWFLHSHLDGTQWLGLAVLVASVLALSWHERLREPSVEAAQPERELATST